VELSQPFFGNCKVSVFVINYFINVSQSTTEVKIILWSFSSLECNIVELEISVVNGSRFKDQTV